MFRLSGQKNKTEPKSRHEMFVLSQKSFSVTRAQVLLVSQRILVTGIPVPVGERRFLSNCIVQRTKCENIKNRDESAGVAPTLCSVCGPISRNKAAESETNKKKRNDFLSGGCRSELSSQNGAAKSSPA